MEIPAQISWEPFPCTTTKAINTCLCLLSSQIPIKARTPAIRSLIVWPLYISTRYEGGCRSNQQGPPEKRTNRDDMNAFLLRAAGTTAFLERLPPLTRYPYRTITIVKRHSYRDFPSFTRLSRDNESEHRPITIINMGRDEHGTFTSTTQ